LAVFVPYPRGIHFNINSVPHVFVSGNSAGNNIVKSLRGSGKPPPRFKLVEEYRRLSRE
jgi:hypothetical protein